MKTEKSTRKDLASILDVEKKQLKNKINSSIYAYRRKKLLQRYSIGLAAASFLVLVAFGVENLRTKNSSIDEFVRTSKNIDGKDLDEVVLVLGHDKSIDIEEDNPTITYSNTGKKVNIGSSKAITQSNEKNDEVVYNTLVVPYGKRSKIELSDGSKVWLNSGSKLVYPVVFNGQKREVYLEGEGIFDVAHNKNKPFMVLAENHEIEVLGTVFNISNYADEKFISTTLKSGSVRIKYKGDSFFKSNNVMEISPGTLAAYDKNANTVITKEVNVDDYFSWREGIFIFKSDNMAYIMKRLSRYYNVNIVLENDDLAKQTFTGYLDLKDNVDRVISTIRETTNFEYNRENETKIVINQNLIEDELKKD